MADPTQAIDTIGPAFTRTLRQLFQPFRPGHWLRLSVVSLLTWEFAGGGPSFNLPTPTDDGSSQQLLAATVPGLPVIVAAAVVVVILSLFLTYVAAVFRFILFETVLYDRCRLGEGWARWQRQGRSLFLWWMGFTVAVLLVLVAMLGVPIGMMWLAGAFDTPEENVVGLVMAAVYLFGSFLAIIIAAMVVHLAVKDWVLPIMALENLGIVASWKRLIPMLRSNWPAYVIFVVMKAVLALIVTIFFTIFYVVLALIWVIPVILIGIFGGVFGHAAGITWSPLVIAAVSLIGGVLVLVVLYLMALAYTPAMVFFQSYSILFFGAQYPKLGEVLAPAPAPPG